MLLVIAPKFLEEITNAEAGAPCRFVTAMMFQYPSISSPSGLITDTLTHYRCQLQPSIHVFSSPELPSQLQPAASQKEAVC